MWKSFLDLGCMIWSLIIFIGFFLGLNKISHHFTRPEMNFWTYMAFPIGAVIPWFIMIGILLWMSPGGTDSATGQTGFLPLAGYATIFAIPIYVIASLIGGYAFVVEATLVSRLVTGTAIASTLLGVLGLGIFILRKFGMI